MTDANETVKAFPNTLVNCGDGDVDPLTRVEKNQLKQKGYTHRDVDWKVIGEKLDEKEKIELASTDHDWDTYGLKIVKVGKRKLSDQISLDELGANPQNKKVRSMEQKLISLYGNPVPLKNSEAQYVLPNVSRLYPHMFLSPSKSSSRPRILFT